MLTPKEKPYLTGLNSYYLQIDKFIEHLQGEIGSGCLYCQAADQELLVYFDEQEILRSIIQTRGQQALSSDSTEPVLDSLTKKSFQVIIYYLDPNSIFFWGQIPPFKRGKAKLKSTDITLPDLVFRLRQKKFSGFIDVCIHKNNAQAVLFFHQGERKGGSYSWGKGGLNPADDDYNRLLGILQTNTATYDIGHFKEEAAAGPEVAETSSPDVEDTPQYFSNLDTAMEEFLAIYIQVTRKKLKVEPLVQLKQQFLDLMDTYPVLDPFNNQYELRDDGTVEFAANAPKEEIASAIVNCAWKAVEDLKLQKKFRAAVKKWDYRSALEERGIDVER